MKINSHVKFLRTAKKIFVCSTLWYAHQTCAQFDNQDITAHLKELSERMNHVQNAITDLFDHTPWANKRAVNSPVHPTPSIETILQAQQQIQKNSSNYFQQTSSALAFANQEKSISLRLQESVCHTKYTFVVTEKQKTIDAHQEPDISAALEQLKKYIAQHFKSTQAQAMLQTCIDALKNKAQNIFIQYTVSPDGHEVTYTIEITPEQEEEKSTPHDKEVDEIEEEEEEIEEEIKGQGNRRKDKKRKSRNSRPRSRT